MVDFAGQFRHHRIPVNSFDHHLALRSRGRKEHVGNRTSKMGLATRPVC